MSKIFDDDPDDFSSFQASNFETLELFRMWELGEGIISILHQHGIDTFGVLKAMEIADINTLTNKLDHKYFGELIKFKAGLRIWRNGMVR